MAVLLVGALVVVVSVAVLFHASAGHRRRVARVRVDDFVVGDLPMVCVRTGAAADGLVATESDESAFQPWWLLLLFLGPVGIVGIVLLATLARRPARIGGSLPMTRAALDEHNRLARIGNWAWGIPVVGGLTGFYLMVVARRSDGLAAAGLGALLVALVGGFVTLLVVGALARRASVSVRLDGTGRWVEVGNVHPDFVTAVDRRNRERHRAARARADTVDPGLDR